MKASFRAALAVAIISILAAPLAATEGRLDLQKARELALARSATVQKAQLAVDSALLAKQAKANAFLPSVSASAGGALDYSAASASEGLSASAKLAATETVYDGGKSATLVKDAGLAADSSREDLRAARLEIVGQADSAFFAALKASASVEAAVGDLDAAKLRLEIARAKAEAGVLAKSDYLMAESEAAACQTALTKAKKTLASARAKLASLTGLPAATELEPIDFSAYDALIARLAALDDAAADGLASAYAGLAAANSPSLAGTALAGQRAKLAVALAKAAYLPTLSAGLSQSVDYGASSGIALGQGSVTLTATLSLDLWNTKNAVETAKVAASSAALDAGESARTSRLDIEVAVNELLASVRSISSSAKALEYADSNYRSVLEKFKLSSASASELSTAEALVSTDKTALIGARYDFLSCLSDIRGLAGLEGDSEILAAIP